VAPPERIEVIPPIVDVDRLASAARFSDLRRRVGLDPTDPVVGLVGGLVPSEDPLLFVRVFATIAASLPAARALVVGDGPERPAMERSARRLGVGDRLHFTGWTSDVAGAYAAMDLLILTSCTDGCALAALEAMAAGTPVVGTRAAGVQDVIDDGRTGLLANPGDAAALAGAAILLLRDPASRERLARAGREEAARRASSSTSAARLEALYREAIALPLTRRDARPRPALRATAG
jgi:glycosyltransferase involved in cell wall biosynthesis